jgi:hypothetical protein
VPEEVELVLGLIERGEEWQREGVIPMEVGQEDREVMGARRQIRVDGEGTGARVDQESVVGLEIDFETGSGPAIPLVLGTTDRDRTSNTPTRNDETHYFTGYLNLTTGDPSVSTFFGE